MIDFWLDQNIFRELDSDTSIDFQDNGSSGHG